MLFLFTFLPTRAKLAQGWFLMWGGGPAPQKGAIWSGTKIKIVSVIKDFSSTDRGQKR